MSIYLMMAIHLHKPITTSIVSDGWLYWLNDTLFFQDNADGIKDKLVVSKTEGEVIDKDSNWIKQMEWPGNEPRWINNWPQN